MKTPEQIAADVYWTLADDALPDSPNGDDYRSIMIATIEADREQHSHGDTEIYIVQNDTGSFGWSHATLF